MRPVDSHCHLDFDAYDEDREQIIEESKEKLEFVVNAGSNLEHNRKAKKLEEDTDGFIKANMGLHPTYTDDFDQLDEIQEQIKKHDPVAVGEIGFDFHHVKEQEMREKQREVFREFLSLAESLEKPVVIHSRDAEEACLEVLEDYDLEGVFLHCFNGRVKLAKEACERGYVIGVTTQVLYSDRVEEIVEEIGLESIVLETDSPFLYRGERNRPVNVYESAEEIAKIKDCDEKTVIEKTTENSRSFFLQ